MTLRGARHGVGAFMGPTPTKRVVFANKLSESPKVLQAILADLTAAGFSQDTVFAIRLAMDEALTNAVRHGNCGDPHKHVTVEYAITDEGFRACVTDEGCGFVPEKLPDPTQPTNLERPCGRGVMLMKAYMSHVSYNEQGNSVTLVKKRDCPLPQRAR